ncbi:MAG: spheroidene monooxygenase [Pseudomonadota bacterium]
MAIARPALMTMQDIGFWKLCGSGTGEGFTPVPNTAVWAILATWPDEATARARTGTEPLFRRWRARAEEAWTVFISATSARGAWSGRRPFEASGGVGVGPVAALTRATIKPRVLTQFWGRVPDIEEMIGSDPNVIFKIGIGEVPWLHQVTFSIWPDKSAMAAFARENGPHAEAIRAVREGAWFREELYARFRVLGDAGRWGGESPLDRLNRSAA